MAAIVVNVIQQVQDSQHEKSTGGSFIDDVYTVLLSVPDQNGHVIATGPLAVALGLPAFASEHATYLGHFVKNVTSKPKGGPLYEVKVRSETPPLPAGGAPDPKNPETTPWEWEWTSEKSIEDVDTDLSGLPIRNTLGFRFDQGVPDDTSDPMLTFKRNEVSFNPAVIDFFEDSVNGAPFLGLVAAHEALIREITASYIHPVIDTTAQPPVIQLPAYYRVRYVIVFRENIYLGRAGEISMFGCPIGPWQKRIANMSHKYFDPRFVGPPASGRLPGVFPFLDAAGNRLNEAQPIAEDGSPSSTTLWLHFQRKPVRDWSSLGIVLPPT